MIYIVGRNEESDSKWPIEWLLGIPCEVPCWQGIHPGKTDMKEAIKIGNTLDTYIDKFEFPSSDPKYTIMDWTIRNGSERINFGFLIDRSSQIVTVIEVTSTYDIVLRDVIKKFGNPSNIIAVAGKETDRNIYDYDLIIIFNSAGIILKSDRIYSPELPVIDEQLILRTVDFYEPATNEMEDILKLVYPTYFQYIKSWKGFVDFKEYCESTVNNYCPR